MKKHFWLLMIAPAMTASHASAQVTDQDAAPQAPATTAQPSESPLMSLDELDELRGGTQVAINQQTFNSENTGNTIGGDFTAGDVNLSDNSLSGFNGLGNVVINTGAQSALQAGLAVTINITD
ncbi:hypothetical protein [Parasphingorhabdus cellanae]|uniref:Uncharacterized protein n=1 Tax=Parasphingorhabdus cellanae TaxID=2806553 RepID=A0ABX7T0Z4_9SPHN|nr:hypothetical protein [Parasphingorhabdus cellanae]QTD55221.1 hypothetical protein J4G78_13465 [Parasphingorhabdus cellanae]